MPFKNAITYLFDIEGANKFKPEEKKEILKAEPKKEVSNKTADYLKNVRKICDDILADAEFVKIKEEVYEDIKYIAETIKFAADKNDVRMVNALNIGLIYLLRQVRKLRYYIAELRNAMEELYLN